MSDRLVRHLAFVASATTGSVLAGQFGTRIDTGRFRHWFAYLVLAVAAYVLVDTVFLHSTTTMIQSIAHDHAHHAQRREETDGRVHHRNLSGSAIAVTWSRTASSLWSSTRNATSTECSTWPPISGADHSCPGDAHSQRLRHRRPELHARPEPITSFLPATTSTTSGARSRRRLDRRGPMQLEVMHTPVTPTTIQLRTAGRQRVDHRCVHWGIDAARDHRTYRPGRRPNTPRTLLTRSSTRCAVSPRSSPTTLRCIPPTDSAASARRLRQAATPPPSLTNARPIRHSPKTSRPTSTTYGRTVCLPRVLRAHGCHRLAGTFTGDLSMPEAVTPVKNCVGGSTGNGSSTSQPHGIRRRPSGWHPRLRAVQLVRHLSRLALLLGHTVDA